MADNVGHSNLYANSPDNIRQYVISQKKNNNKGN